MGEADRSLPRPSQRREVAVAQPWDEPMFQRGGPTAASPEAKLRGAARALSRHIWLVLFTLLVVNSVAIAAIEALPRRFTAEAVVMIGPREPRVTDMKSVIEGLSPDTDVLETEIQVVKSRRVARQVVEELRLDRNADFNPGLTPPSLFSRIVGSLNHSRISLPIKLRGDPGLASSSPIRPRQDPVDRTADALLLRLSVSAKGQSRAIGISVDASDPVVAAKVANAVAEAYIGQQLQEKMDATAHAHRWLEERVAELHQMAIIADKTVAAYRIKSGLMRGTNGSLITEQISELGRQIIEARVTKANAIARLQTLGVVPGSRLEALPDVQNSPIIRDLRQQEALLTAQYVQLAATHGPNYPQVAALNAEIQAIRGRERAEIGYIGDTLRDAVRTAEARETMLEHTLAGLRDQAGVASQHEIELHSLQQEDDADRALYERLLARSKETQIEVGLQQPDAQLISSAEPPDAPSFPKPALMLAVAFATSCILAALLVFGLESLDMGFWSLDQVETVLGVPALGVVPRIQRRSNVRSASEFVARAEADPLYAEALRSLYTSLLLKGTPRPKVVLFASANSGEGKTTIVLSLARMLASNGKRVVIVDCDVARPSMNTVAGIAHGSGLRDCLIGKADVGLSLQRDQKSGVWLLPAGEKRPAAPDLFASHAMESLIGALADQFDLVLLDSAPVLLISDTRALAHLADKTVFVARWGVTRRMQVSTAIRQIADAGGHVAGVLLSIVDMGRYARWGEGSARPQDLRLYLAN
jgi:polysaccharide biosynthesis transport protein